MASGFSRDEDKCQGLGCQKSTRVTYYVKEKKKLCEDCANKTGCISKVRKNESKLFCVQHDKPKELYCESHSLALCQLCAFTEHQKPCRVKDIDVILKDKKEKLLHLKQRATDENICWNDCANKIQVCRQVSKKHLKAVTSEVNSVFHEGTSKIKDNEKKSATKINEEADEEIRKITNVINKKREARLKKCHEDAEKEHQPMESRRRELLADITAIENNTQRTLDDLQADARDVLQAMDDTTQRIETLLENNEELLNGGQQLIASISDTLKKTVDKDVLDSITSKVKSVRFKRGGGHEKYNGRIWHHGKWELSRRVEVPDPQKLSRRPYVAGYISEDKAILSGFHKNCIHIVNMNNGNTTRLKVPDDITSCIGTCTMLDNDTIVCSMRMKVHSGDSMSRCIHLYDRQWKLIKDITIPTHTSASRMNADVAVDQDGMIIAAERVQSYIYIINPADGHIVKEIKCKDAIKLRGVLSSGDIVARPYCAINKLLIIDRQGAQREILCTGRVLGCTTDPLTDDLYVLSFDRESNTAVVHCMTSDGHFDQEGPVITFNTCSEKLRALGLNVLKMRKSGDITAWNGAGFLLYKKTY